MSNAQISTISNGGKLNHASALSALHNRPLLTLLGSDDSLDCVTCTSSQVSADSEMHSVTWHHFSHKKTFTHHLKLLACVHCGHGVLVLSMLLLKKVLDRGVVTDLSLILPPAFHPQQ